MTRSPFLKSSGLCLLLAALAAAQPAGDGAPGGTGLVFDPARYRGVPYKAPVTDESYAAMPSRASLTKHCPTPGDQGPLGTCTAFALAYHTRTILWAIEHRETDRAKIDRQVFSPAFLYERIKKEADTDCQGGSSPVVGLEFLKRLGVAREKTVPYTCSPEISGMAVIEALGHRIKDYQILFVPDEEDAGVRVRATKKAISEGWPVVLAFIVPKSFYRPGRIWRAKAGDGGPSGKHGRHAMVVVGYDDGVAGGAFRVLNSWGPKWADGGYVWIPYDEYAKYALGAMQVYGKRPPPAPKPKPKPKPDPDPEPEPEPAYASLLEGEVAFQRRDGTPMPASRVEKPDDEPASGETLSAYRLDRAWPSGTRFRFFIETNTEVYLYAFATDETREITQILPFRDNMSPLIGPRSTIAFPSERKVVRMDDQPGTDYLLILYCADPLDIDQVRTRLEGLEGTLSQRVKTVFGDKLIRPAAIRFAPRGIGFSIERRVEGSVVPLMIEIEHM